ncbi:MAG: R3H domain-containing nucleic acid-binding protein [Armatimonadota bacterium]|nr:R3H domain-containing nucleic acid-binding protein [Armatimonadota bacterium]
MAISAEPGHIGAKQLRVTDNLAQLLDVLPPLVRRCLEEQNNLEDLLEIVLDLGREAEARFPGSVVQLCDIGVTMEEIDYVVSRVGMFGKDNRAGIERTLHRISAIRNRQGKIVGLTCRIGRAVYGTIDIIRDVIETGKSALLLGRPGVGKTTKLREVARVLGDEFKKRVVVVDTSNEIAGDGDIPHPAIGSARRMQVATPDQQHAVMIEAVENHMPEVVVIDEIGTEADAFAARTIAERGVQLIATAHGNSLENLLMNPTLSDLVGGIHAVTLSDDEAKRRRTQKTVLERKAPPTFDVVIEIIEVDKLAIHHDVSTVVDKLLRGQPVRPEIRVRNPEGEVEVVQAAETEFGRRPEGEEYGRVGPVTGQRALPSVVKIFPYGVSRNRLERAIRELRVPAYITKDANEANAVIALKAHFRKEPAKLRDVTSRDIPTYVVKSNTYTQIATSVREMFNLRGSDEDAALREAEEAIERALEFGEAQELMPQNSYMRRLQHQLVEKSKLTSVSIGAEPYRRLRIMKP